MLETLPTLEDIQSWVLSLPNAFSYPQDLACLLELYFHDTTGKPFIVSYTTLSYDFVEPQLLSKELQDLVWEFDQVTFPNERWDKEAAQRAVNNALAKNRSLSNE